MYGEWGKHECQEDVEMERVCEDGLMGVVEPSPAEGRPHSLP